MSARNVVLFLIFGGLIYGAYTLYHAQTQKPLQADLISIDTNQISRLRIYLPEGQGPTVQLQRQEDYWIASNDLVHLRATNQAVQGLLQNLVKVTTIDIATTSEADWPTYGLSPNQSVRIQVYNNTELMEDFWLAQHKQATTIGDSVSFIRIHQEKEVYAVYGLSTDPFFSKFPGL